MDDSGGDEWLEERWKREWIRDGALGGLGLVPFGVGVAVDGGEGSRSSRISNLLSNQNTTFFTTTPVPFAALTLTTRGRVSPGP